MAQLAFLGFGELAASLASGLSHPSSHRLRAYVRVPLSPGTAQRVASAQIECCHSLEQAVAGADVVLSAVPADSALAVARAAAACIESHTLYVDLTSSPPDTKLLAARAISGFGGCYADAAVLGTVAVSGSQVPILLSGEGARSFQQLAQAEGLNVRALDAPAGQAALIKLLRSIYLKGRDALIVEMLVAARRYGLEEEVVSSIGGRGEEIPFDELVGRVLQGLAVHAARRADELHSASTVAEQVGIDPALSRAAANTLRRIGELGLREHFAGERPDDPSVVVSAIDSVEGIYASRESVHG